MNDALHVTSRPTFTHKQEARQAGRQALCGAANKNFLTPPRHTRAHTHTPHLREFAHHFYDSGLDHKACEPTGRGLAVASWNMCGSRSCRRRRIQGRSPGQFRQSFGGLVVSSQQRRSWQLGGRVSEWLVRFVCSWGGVFSDGVREKIRAEKADAV